MHMVWNVQLPVRQRVGLLIIFGAGFLYVHSPCFPSRFPSSLPSPILFGLRLRLPLSDRYTTGVNKTNRVCVAGALRLYYSITTDKSPDTPWEGFSLWIWESIEINLGIVCASAPSLKSFLTRLVPKLFSSQNSTPSNDFPSFERERAGYSRGKGTERLGTGRRDAGRGFTMTTVTAGRSARKGGGGSESQDDLTAGWEGGSERVLVAKVDVHDMA